jgi:hypothetical protein
MFAFFAALNLHDARVLFSKHKVSELMDPSAKSKKSALERHHLFPKEHLKTIGITDSRETNQIANFTLIEWGDNGEISGEAPADYVPSLQERFTDKELAQMYSWHALPENWEAMDYQSFLKKRRELMATVIRDAYLSLAGHSAGQAIKLMPIEFKSTLRTNMHTGEKDPKMELAVLKTIAAFLNMNGGTLIVGVSDDGEPVGVEADKFPDEDKMNLHLVNIIKERIGPSSMLYISPRFDDYQDARVLVLECLPAKTPIFVKDGNIEKFFVRTGAATSELSASQTQGFIKSRFVA